VALVGFVIRELTAPEPLLDLTIFRDRNVAVSSIIMAMAGFGFYASMLLLALYTQKLMGYDAWTSGLVLAPSGIGQAMMMLFVGRLVMHVDQRLMLAFGVGMNALATFLMSHITLGTDFWSLAWPRLIQGIGMGFIFVPLQTLALGYVSVSQLPTATAAFNVVRNVGGSIGLAIVTTLLARRAQVHQFTLVANIDVWDPQTTERLRHWTEHFAAQGSDAVTAGRQAIAMLYRDAVSQAQVLAFIDDFRLLAFVYAGLILLIPLLRRVRTEPAAVRDATADVPTRAAIASE
jgi:DHA2 family multidrug resistance protein